MQTSLVPPILLAAVLLPAAAMAQKHPVTQPLATAAVVGQGVALLPINMVVIDPNVPTGTVSQDRATLIRWTDSLLADGAESRVPEVKWVPPNELRRVARRSGGLLADPNQMGQSVMRSWGLTVVPDPLRSNLRKLLAVAGGWRYALIPAALIIKNDSTGQLEADLSILLADTRTGKVVWRSVAKGRGGTVVEVLGKAVATIFPIDEERQP